MNSTISYVLSKKYVNDTTIALGGVKGASAQIAEIEVSEDGKSSEVTYSWQGNDGTIQRQTMTVKNGVDGKDGKDGTYPVSTYQKQMSDGKHLIIVLSDGSEMDCGVFNAGGGTGTSDYDDLQNAPIKNIHSESPIDLATLESGIYRIKGDYYLAEFTFTDINDNALISVSKEAKSVIVDDPDLGVISYIYDTESGKWIETKYDGYNEATSTDIENLFEK